MPYKLQFTKEAQKEMNEWKHSGEKKDLEKINNLFSELESHPTSGTGHVEELRDNLDGFWSRHINENCRLVYSINRENNTVEIISLRNHYGNH